MTYNDRPDFTRQSRRGFLASTAALGAAMASGGLLAACGGDDGDGGGNGGEALTGAALGERLRELLGEPTNILSNGPGNFPVMGSFALTGQGSIYGKLQTEGFQLGAQHVAAWTNNQFNMRFEALDNASGDPEALVANVRRAGREDGVIFPSSYIWGFGAQVEPLAQAKMLSLEPGGGTGPLLQGVPYCYGFRTAYPVDLQPGLYRTVKEFHPDVTRVAAIDAEIAAEYNNAVEERVRQAAADNDMELVAFATAPLAQTDYSSVVSRVRGENPDAILCSNFGTDVGYLSRNIQQQGIEGAFGAVDFTPDGAQIAGPAYRDWIFSQDYINASEPPSDWSSLFVDACREEFNDVQNYHAAYYAAAFAYAITLERLLEAGGDIRDGDDWVEAFESDLQFPHVYGGSGSDLGQIVLDEETHSPQSIPIIALRAGGTGSTEDFEVLARYDLGLTDYERVG